MSTSGPSRFRLNSPRVLAETADGEAIIVNLGAGAYYTIAGDGVPLWHAIIDGFSAKEIAEAVAETAGETLERAQAAVADFSVVLAEAGLIVERDARAAGLPGIDLSGCGAGLLEPRIEVYTDLEDLILLDPVHEVDERGWPLSDTGA